jgi:hypothetical protein
MWKKISLILGIVFLLNSMPAAVISQTDQKTEEHHTGVKRTYHKAKRTVRKAWRKTKAATSKEYNKVKTRATTDDDKRDATERK